MKFTKKRIIGSALCYFGIMGMFGVITHGNVKIMLEITVMMLMMLIVWAGVLIILDA